MTTEQKFRLEAMRLALGLSDPDKAASLTATIQNAATIYRYIADGNLPTDPIINIVGRP